MWALQSIYLLLGEQVVCCSCSGNDKSHSSGKLLDFFSSLGISGQPWSAVTFGTRGLCREQGMVLTTDRRLSPALHTVPVLVFWSIFSFSEGGRSL